MKINIMKIGATINANNGSILTDEINVVTKMLADSGHDVHYHTTRTRSITRTRKPWARRRHAR